MSDFFGIGTTVSGIGGALISGLFGARNQDKSNQANKDIAAATNEANLQAVRETNKTNYDVAMENLGFQRENLDYQKALQQQLFAREDTSYQRTVNDMRAAGISPLAMQGLNGAGSAVETQPLNNSFEAVAPHFEGYTNQAYDPTDAVRLAFEGVSQGMNQIQNSLYQREQLKIAQADADVRHQEASQKIQESIQRIQKMIDDNERAAEAHEAHISTESLRQTQLELINQLQEMENNYFRDHPENFSRDRFADAVSPVVKQMLGATSDTPMGAVISDIVNNAVRAITGSTSSGSTSVKLPARGEEWIKGTVSRVERGSVSRTRAIKEMQERLQSPWAVGLSQEQKDAVMAELYRRLPAVKPQGVH